MHSLNLVPFEDIIEEFEAEFGDELENYSQLKDLVIGDLYTTWDFIFLSETYKTQTTGILGVHLKIYNKP